MTDPYHTQQPQPPYQPQVPYQHGGPVVPPIQHQPAGYPPPTGPTQPTGFITTGPARRSNRKPLIAAAAAAIAVLLLVIGGYGVYDRFIREDTGVAACKAMRDGKQADGSAKDSGDDKLTEAEYRKARKVFEDSRHDDIREHGTALMDLAWQISQMPKGQEMGALAYVGPMTTHMSGLQTACANQGVIVTLDTK